MYFPFRMLSQIRVWVGSPMRNNEVKREYAKQKKR
jgi:hypothetical protein